MDKLLSEYEVRLQKCAQLQRQFKSAYPANSVRTHTCKTALDEFDQLGTENITLTGRIRLLRGHGRLTFARLEDASGKIQLVFSEKDLGEAYKTITTLFDVGDIISATGTVFITKRGEQSLLVKSVIMLAKALRPLPDKWHGLQDEELRYRERYLDILMNPELKELFLKKSKFWQSIRNFLLTEGFLEVETPVLEATPGGADAQPFITHHHALDIDLYLRISMGELWQKRLMVAGFEKTFEIGRQFRNEGISNEHLQDYTQMEFYWAYANYQAGMQLVERLFKTCIKATFNTLQFNIRGFAINLDQPWQTIDYAATVQKYTNINVATATEAEMQKRCVELKIKVPAGQLNRARLIDQLWKHCRKQITGPMFLINHPVTVSPLAKGLADRPGFVERYQIIIAGSELGNGYTELNDPQEQAARFMEQTKLREAGDTEAQRHDEDFVRALEYGMPPTTGFGLSERLFSFLMDKPIRECVLFPLLRPKH
ncbi:MAG: lysine--tRNA ligase [Patescibacteria group bacterium]|jgi:lysyl-tRNA synthetase class 2